MLSLFGVNPPETLSSGYLDPKVVRSTLPHNHLSVLLRVAPQHVLGGVIGVALVLKLKDSTRFHAVASIVLVCIAWWSPYNAVGVLFLFMGVVASTGLRPFLTWQNLLVAPLLLVPLTLFVLAPGPVSARTRWIWELLPLNTLIWLLPFFYGTAILPWFGMLLSYFRERRCIILLCSVVVATICLPLYQVEAHYIHGNEFLKNGLLPVTVAVWYWVAPLTCRIVQEAVTSISVRQIVAIWLLSIMLLPGFNMMVNVHMWVLNSTGLYRHESNPKSIGDYEFGDMYLVDEWQPPLKAVLKD